MARLVIAKLLSPAVVKQRLLFPCYLCRVMKWAP